MINRDSKVAVCSRSFSSNKTLRGELLEQFPNSIFNDSGLTLNGDALAEFVGNAEGAIVALEKIDESVLSKIPQLKVIGKYGVGVNNIDFYALERSGIQFGWTKGVNKRAVAELTLGFAISLLRSLSGHNAKMSSNKWQPVVGRELSESAIGLIGCGHVGKDVVRLLSAFGTKVLVHDIDESAAQRDFYLSANIEHVSKSELLKRSDLVSLHIPFHEGNRHVIGKNELRQMKATAYLINTARGGLVDEAALFEALSEKTILGAAFDVFEEEPAVNNPLLTLENFYSTPHIGGSTETSVLAMGRSAIKGLSEYAEAKNYIGVY